MVEKPQEGKCAKCGSENVKFYDDGFGRCLDCGRTFQWMEEDEKQQQQPQQQQPQQQQRQQSPEKQQTTSRQPQSQQQRSERTSKSSQPAQQQQPQKSSRQPQPTQQRSTQTKPSTRSRKTTKKTSKTKKSKVSKDYLYITSIGFILAIIGYIILSTTAMGFDIKPDTMQMLRGIYMLLSYTGVLLIGLGLVKGALTADHLDKKIRSWMLIATAILLGLFLSFNMLNMLGTLGGV